jgi:CheY-like chemotaxis protein
MLDWDAVSTWTILVVEDERDNADVISSMLKYYGASVKWAANGKIGLEMLQSFTPTLILMDLSMPTMDGWEMHRQLKANPAWQAIPVVALSAHAMEGDKERVLDAGFDGYVTKPIHVRTLIADLRRTMDEAAQRRIRRAAEPPDSPPK